MKVLVLAGFSQSLINFRKELLSRMVYNGHEVIAVGPENDCAEELRNMGIKFIQLKFDRLAVNPIKDVKFTIELIKIMNEEKPDIYFGYTIKPVIYGSIAACLSGIKNRFAMVTGLGSVFIEGESKRHYIKYIVKILYKMGFSASNYIFFQNKDDILEFTNMKLIPKEKCLLVNGSGVNLEYYSPQPMQNENIFLFVGSLMGDKGIHEYINAAAIVKKKYENTRFWIVGPMDRRLTSMSESKLNSFVEEGIVEYFGSTNDVRPFYKQCRFYVLPSYREGTPRSVLEAMATGRPIITTDAPGCKETVENNINGFLVPVRNVDILADKMIWLIRHPEEAECMGRESLKIAISKYDVNKINKYMLKIMKLENME